MNDLNLGDLNIDPTKQTQFKKEISDLLQRFARPKQERTKGMWLEKVEELKWRAKFYFQKRLLKTPILYTKGQCLECGMALLTNAHDMALVDLKNEKSLENHVENLSWLINKLREDAEKEGSK